MLRLLQYASYTVLALCLIAGAVVFLHHKGMVYAYAPRVARLIDRIMPPDVESVLWRGVSQPQQPGNPAPGAPAASPRSRKPEQNRRDQRDVIYQWVDENGVQHFTNAAPPEGARDVVVLHP